MKGIFDLTGARMIHTHESSNTLEILLPQGIGNEIILEAPTEDAVSLQFKCIIFCLHIQFSSSSFREQL